MEALCVYSHSISPSGQYTLHCSPTMA